MTEAAAAGLTPTRAAELARVLELQSEWENLAADREHTTARLHAVQKAFDTYRSRMLAYTARDRTQPVPELTLTKSSRLGTWCRTVAGGIPAGRRRRIPTHVMVKVRRVAGRIAGRLRAEPPATEGATDLAGAIRQLDAVIAWCDGLEENPRPAEASYEVGGCNAGRTARAIGRPPCPHAAGNA